MDRDWIKWIFIVLIGLTNLTALQAQNQVTATIQVMPPYPNKISSYEDPNKFVINLKSNSRSQLNVQLRGAIVGENGIVIRVSEQFKSPQPIVLNAFETRNLNGLAIRDLFDINKVNVSGISLQELVEGNGVPEGIYRVCIRAYDYYTNMPLSQDEPLGCSNLMRITNLEPPFIIKPYADEIVKYTTPQNVLFTWSFPAGAPPTTRFKLTIVEIFNNDRNINDAILSSTVPPFFEQTVTGNAFLFGPTQPTLVQGRRYAFMVTAFDPVRNTVFRNEGRSEVASFTYQPPEPTTAGPGMAREMQSGISAKAYLIPKVKITGRVVWSFRKSETGVIAGSLANSLSVATVSGASLQSAFIDPNYATQHAGTVQQQVLGNSASMIIMGSNAGEPPQALQPSQTLVNRLFIAKPSGNAAAIPVFGGSGPSSASVSSVLTAGQISVSAIAQLADKKDEYPLASHTIKVVGGGYNPMPIGVAQTDEDGNFSIEFVHPNHSFNSSSKFNFVDIVIGTEHFLFENPQIDLNNPNRTEVNLGTIRGLAKTYRLVPKVIDIDDEHLPLDSVVIDVFRPTHWYAANANLKWEGNLALDGRKEEKVNGTMMTKVASAKGSAAIAKLFFNKKGFGDQYYVRVAAYGYHTLIKPLIVTPQGDFENGVVSISQTFEMTAKLPEVFGRVTRADNHAPMAGVTVVVKKKPASAALPVGSLTVDKLLQSTYNYGTISVNTGTSTGGGASTNTSIPLAGSLQTGLMSQVMKVTDAKNTSYNLDSQSGRILFGDGIPGARPTAGTSVGGGYGAGGGNEGNVSGALAKNEVSIISAEEYGAIINLIPKEGLTYATAVTDEDGYYHIANIKPDKNPYEILVIGKNIKSTEPNTVLLDAKGISVHQDLHVNMTLVEVKGKVVNDQGEPMANVQVKWKSGGNPILTNNDGVFSIQTVPGADVLSLWKSGHNEYDSAYVITTAKSQDLGTFILYRLMGRLMVKVLDKTAQTAINGATVSVGDDVEGLTTGNGEVYFEGAIGGDIPVKVNGPAGEDYIPTLPQTVTVSLKGDTTKIAIELSIGARATGTVRSGGNTVAGAKVLVHGRDDLTATTANDGSYTLRGIPLGEYKLVAVKSGLIGDDVSHTFTSGSHTLNFNLQASSMDISTLLGFPIEVESFSEADMTISGAFIDIPGNALFKTQPGMKLPFSYIKVKKAGNGIEPVSGEVQTDASEIKLKVFDFMNGLAKSPGGVVVKKVGTDASKGSIVARVGIDYSALQGSLFGWSFQTPETHFLKTSATGPAEVTIFTSSGELPNAADSLLIGASGNQQMTLYGFGVNLDIGKSALKADGLHVRGSVKLSDVPLLSSASFDLRHLWISTDGTVKEAALGLSPAPKINLSTWSLTINTAQLSEMGFRLSGNVDITIPSSPKSTLSFTNLAVSTDQLYGGDFVMPAAGINVFNIVTFKTAQYSKISFTQIPNSNIYAVAGNATVTFPKYLEKTLDVKSFVVQTDGKFTATIPANYKADFFGLAKFEISNIAFKTTGTPGIDVTGGMSLDAIPFITASAGGIRFGTAGKVSVDKINLGFSLASVAEVKIGVGFIDTPQKKGFEGSGSLTVASTPFGGAVKFYYYKLGSSGIDFGADFVANTPPIVLSPVTTITKVGGGFGYKYDSKAGKKKYRITIRGAMSVAPGTDLLVALDPLEVTVESGPVIKGYTAITVINQKIANAKLLIDLPNTLFNVEAQFGVGFLEDIGVKNEGGSILVISGKPSDAYWMVGAYFRIDVLGLIQNNGYMAAGWNVNINAHPELSSYTHFIPHDFRSNGTTLNGVHFKAMSQFGLTRENAACGNILDVAEGCVWFFNKAEAVINANLAMRKLGIMVGTSWGGGADVKIAGKNIAGASIGAGVAVAGAYSPIDGWYFNGKGHGHLSAWFGSCTNACQTKICWGGCFNACVLSCEVCPIPVGGKICVNPSLDVSYSSKTGASVSVGL